MCCDFEELLSLVVCNDFVYLDPPYWIQGSNAFSEYHKDSFSFKDLDRMSTSLNHLDKIGAKFLVSYADCPDAHRIFNKWNCRKVTTKRNISGFVSTRRNAFELLATNI